MIRAGGIEIRNATNVALKFCSLVRPGLFSMRSVGVIHKYGNMIILFRKAEICCIAENDLINNLPECKVYETY